MTAITNETILKTRKYFSDNKLACIAEMDNGEVTVNNPEEYRKDCLRLKDEILQGMHDNTLAFKQMAYYFQTGECVAILP